jgi:hypothetical protein
LTDEEIVRLSNYLFEHYGRPGVAVTAAQVAEVRRGGPSSSLIVLARVGLAAAAIGFIALVAAIFVRKRKRSEGAQL